MRNRRSVYLWLNSVLVVLLFLTLTLRVILEYRFNFTSIDSAVVSGNTVWGINSDSEEMTVFHVSADTGIGDYLKIPMFEKERIVTVSDPFVSDGRVYFHKTLCDADGSYTEQLVSWNLDKNRLVVVKNPDSVLKKEKSGNDKDKDSDISGSSDEEEYTLSEVEPEDYEDEVTNASALLCIGKDGEDTLLKGVQREFGKSLRKVIFYLLGSLLIFAVLTIVCSLIVYYRIYLGTWLRMGIIVLLLGTICLLVFSKYFNSQMYEFSIDHVMYHCDDFGYIRAFSLNEDVIEKCIAKGGKGDAVSVKGLWKYNIDDAFADKEIFDEGQRLSVFGNKSNRRAWDLYDDYVVDEESCIIYIQNGAYRILRDENGSDDPWLLENRLAEQNRVERAFSAGKSVSLNTSAGKRRYAESFVPVVLDSGTKVLVATRIPLINALRSCRNALSGAIRIGLFLAVCSGILFLAVIIYSLWPIRSLMHAVKSITAGDLSVRAKTTGNGELDYLSRLFNSMADRLSKQGEGADTYRFFYEAFIPASLLQSMSSRSVAGALRPEAVYRADACCMVMDVTEEDDSAEEKNRLLETEVRIAERYGGHPIEFDDERVKIICTEGSEAALRTVTSIEQNLVENHRNFAWIGMTSCEVSLSVIGTDRRKNVVEHDSHEAELLSEIAADLNIPVILTEALYLDVMHKTAKFQFRCLGRIGRNGYEPEAPLYELLDANTASRKAIRKYTTSVFEQGVSAYASGNYFKARNDMVRALELDPEDLAARCYILNCDRKEPPKVCQAMKQAD